ncbi:hypothetical protein ACN47E_004891 [Coniothyrium glycines]
MDRRRQNTGGDRPQATAGPIGLLTRGIAAGIGLARESYEHRKEKKASNAQENEDTEDTIAISWSGRQLQQDAHLSQQMDEAVWELDEAQDQVADRSSPPAYTEEELAGLAASFLVAHPQPPPYPSTQLSLPVVITQRRPESRTKGFVRAYSPLLADVGIDQKTFLDFLDNLNKSIAPSPWIQAINLAAFAGQNVPEPFTIMISIAVKMAADAASELHSRSKTNKFLDRINESYFAPRGLVALIMTWKPNQKEDKFTRVDFEMQSMIASASGTGKSRRTFESSSGATSFEWPETAPLVFPVLDELADKKQSMPKRSGKFVGEYMDKRARAKWAGENPDSAMANATGKEKFSSRYADPNHPASSGDPIALLTGGFLQAGFGRQAGASLQGDMRGGLRGGLMDRQGSLGLGRGRLEGFQRGELSSREHGRAGLLAGRDGFQRGALASRGVDRGSLGGGGLGGSGIGPLSLITGVKKLLQDDVLYLMIVQQPTEAQMTDALHRMGASSQGRR